MITVTANNSSGSNMLMLGLGNAGGKAAFYALQRGGLPGLRFAALDSDAAALELLKGINTELLPPPELILPQPPPATGTAEPPRPASTESGLELEEGSPEFTPAATLPESPQEKQPNPTASLTAEGREKLHAFLDSQFPTLRLLVAVFGLGGDNGGLYGLETIRYAKEHGLACGAVVILPHPFEKASRHEAANARLGTLHALTQAHIVLPCGEFVPLFDDSTKDDAFPQGVRWLADCTLGFLKPFAMRKPRKKIPTATADNGTDQLTFIFTDQPTGIFVGSQPTNLNGQNLDIPTYQRLNIEIETEADVPDDY